MKTTVPSYLIINFPCSFLLSVKQEQVKGLLYLYITVAPYLIIIVSHGSIEILCNCCRIPVAGSASDSVLAYNNLGDKWF